jgi:two-component system CheB/CheR fusion protein
MAASAGDMAHMSANERLRELALHESPLARIVVDANGTVVIINQKARQLFSLSPKDVGRPLQDLEVSYRPTELHSIIEQAYSERRMVTRTNVERRFGDGETHHFEVVAQPLLDDAQAALGVAITFIDVTRSHRLQEELQRSREEIQTASEELQSSNQELETMNEELQSTNEALQTVNDELRQRTDELKQANAFLGSVLGSMRGAAVVVDRDLNILVWNDRAQDLWGLRPEEVQGKSVLNLEIGLPVGELRAPIRASLHDGADREVTLDAVNRRGKAVRCRVTCTPLLSPAKRREGVILTMDEVA